MRICTVNRSNLQNCNQFTVSIIHWLYAVRQGAALHYSNMPISYYWRRLMFNSLATSGNKLMFVFLWFQFVAHPACQQRLVNIWYAGMRKLERSSWPQRFTLMLGFVILYPVLFFIYLIAPASKVR